MGDYLGVGNRGGGGELIRNAINLGNDIVFSARCDVLVSKFGKSSKPEPRILVLTSKNLYIVKQAIVERRLVISAERTMPIGSIKFISTSTLKDDWFAIGAGSAQEADPLVSCVFKTEFFTMLRQILRGSLNLKINDRYVGPLLC